MTIEIVEFDPAAAEDEVVRGCYDVDVEAFSTEYPDRPIPSFEEYAAGLRNPQSVLGRRRFWIGLEPRAGAAARVVGLVSAAFAEDENKHMSVVHTRVAPKRRRLGIGTDLVRAAVAAVRESGRGLIGSQGLKAGGDGEQWAAAHGFRRVSELVLQRLRLDESASVLEAARMPDGFRAQIWVGALPEEVVTSCAAVLVHGNVGTIADARRRELEWSVDRVRDFEVEMREAGHELWTAAALREDGSAAAVTMVAVPWDESEACYQQDTVVLPELRRRGLATAVKAALLRDIAARRPNVEQVFTHIDHRNEAMIRTNEGLGFRTDARVARFEADVHELAERLGV